MALWCEVAWIKLGDANLSGGRHTLQIRPLPLFKEEKKQQAGADGKPQEVLVKKAEKILYVSDCLCLYQGQFRPNGAFKPDADWQTDEDRKAAAVVFDVPAGARPDERIEAPLAGLWQVCRDDEQEVIDRTGPTKVLPDAATARWMAIGVPGNYQESFWRDYPDEAYTLAKAYQAHEKPLVAWGIVPWRLVPERPIFMGEAFYVRGNSPAAFSQFAGEGCFTGWGPATRLGAGLIAKMIAEGHRWHGVAAHHFCFNSEESTDLHFNSWKPVCVFCRQWNWTFGGGSVVPRTLKVFNDTHLTDPIEMAWQLRLADQPVAGEQKVYHLAPGQHEEVQISVAVPQVSQRTAGQFILTCSRGGKEVFREVKNVAVIARDSVAKPSLSAGQLAVLDPQGAAKARLQARGIAFTEVQSLAEVPAQARVVLVGR